MGISIKNLKPLNAVRLVSRIDDAIDHDASDWDKYDEDPSTNESAIRFLEGKSPTIFLLNFDFRSSDACMIEDARLTIKGKEVQPAMGSWARVVAKVSLKGIENPPGTENPIQLKLDSRSHVSDQTLDVLSRAGIISEIFKAYITLVESSEEKKNLKN